MRKIKYFLGVFVMLSIVFTFSTTVNAASQISLETLFTPSSFDSLVLNYSSLPTVTVTGSASYTLSDAESSGYSQRRITYNNVTLGSTLDSTVTVFFENCGTLNGQAIDVKYVYSDIVTKDTTSSAKDGSVYMYWTAFGSTMTSDDEWFYNHIEHVTVNVYFYYHGSSTPINLDLAYLTLFSEDGNEGARSSTASDVYLYEETTMNYATSYVSSYSNRTYTDFYYGSSGTNATDSGSLNSIAFEYKNTDHLTVELYAINDAWHVGYHLQYTPITATIPDDPVKTVDETETEAGDTITYTIKQDMPVGYDSAYYLSSYVFSDVLDSNLTYQSIKVYSSDGTDKTSSAGAVSYNSTTNTVNYTFSENYLKNIDYTGQTYTYVITATVKDSPTSGIITNAATVTLNDKYVLTSNDVTTKVNAQVIAHYVDTKGNTIAQDETTDGIIGDSYKTEEKTISGYKLVSTEGTLSGTMNTPLTEVTYYYTNEVELFVNYVDYYTHEEITDGISQIYYIDDIYTTDKKTISGYTYVEDSGNTSGTFGTEDIEVTYYYKKNTSVIVKYVDINTDEELETQVTISGMQGDEYETEEKKIEGYVFVEVDGDTQGQMPKDTTTITYYYAKAVNVTVRYVNEDTNKEIAESITTEYKQGDAYTTVKEEISGYTYTKDTLNTSGTVGSEDIEVVYYYKKATSVTVNYLDINTNETIATQVVIEGYVGSEYQTEQKDIDGYLFVEVDSETYGTMISTAKTINYYYVKQSKVIARYVDETTGELIADSVSTVYSQGDYYTTEQKAITGYTFTKYTGEKSGKVERNDIEVTYYYKKNATVLVQYIDMTTGETIADEETITGLVGDDYTTEQKAITGYEFEEVSGRTIGQMTSNTTTVVYKYKKLANLITEHIDFNTKEKIIDDVVTTYKEGEEYEALPQSIDGYVLVQSPDETIGTIQREDITKTFYYKKISAGLVVKYVDVITEELLDQEEYTGNENDLVELDEKSFTGYELYSRPEYDTVALTVEAQEVIFYYIRPAKVIVEGIDQDTSEVLYEYTLDGYQGDEYQTEAQDVDGYTLVVTPDNTEGTYEKDTITVTYEYKKKASSVSVTYIDIDTGEIIYTGYEVSGLLGDEYETVRETIDNYNLVEVDGEEVGTLTDEEKEVTYYYEKVTGYLVVTYVDEDGNELAREEASDYVGESYTTSAKEIDGYTLVETPSNAAGTYVDGTTEVVYVYHEIKYGTITVKFVDEDGNELYETVEDEDEEGVTFYLVAPTIEGYTVTQNATIDTAFTDGALEYTVVYTKDEEEDTTVTTTTTENPDTGDIAVVALAVVAVICVGGIVAVILRNRKRNRKE